MTQLRTVTLFCLALLFASNIRAQNTTTDFSQPGISDEMTANPDQNKMWRTGQSKYPSKPKSMWEVGLHAGTAFISGDVEAPFPAGMGFGLHLRKALNYTLSLRLDGSYQVSRGLDARSFDYFGSERTYLQNQTQFPQLFGYTNQDINTDNIHRNYKTSIMAFSLEGILNVGNVLFHNSANKWNMYGIIGAGFYIPDVKVNLLNGDQLYDFSSATAGVDLNTSAGRKEARKRVRELLDDSYELKGGQETDVSALGNKKSFIPHLHLGVGLSRKLSSRMNIGVEYRVRLSDNDLLDGFEYRTSGDQTTSNDVSHYAAIRLGINIGNKAKRTEPLYWVNPLDAPLTDLAELKQRPKFDLTDTDGDGVIDLIDQEMNTPTGCPVDTRGITLDSDGDGVVDCKDQEPYSPPGHEVSPNGVAIITNPPMTEDQVVELINQRTDAISSTMNWFLPMIHFDLNKYYIKPEFYGAIHHVASVLKSHPDVKVVVKGFTDVRASEEYNNVLSFNRAQEAINFMMTNYNLPRSRFILNFDGENEPIAQGLKEKSKTSPDEEYKYYMNRRVEFRVAKPEDKDMSRPPGPEAGENTPGSGRQGSKYSGNYNSGY